MVGLDSSWRTIFCSEAGNFQVSSFGFGSFHFLVTMVKLLLGALKTATLAQEVAADVAVTSVGAEVFWSWVIPCSR